MNNFVNHCYSFFFIIALVTIISCNIGSKNSTKDAPPNVILIMADDLGYGGIGSYGNDLLKTPHLDKMAEQGLRFTDFHANGSVCTPTRAALLTGRYQQRSGMEGVIYVRGETREVGLDTSEVTIAELLQTNNIATGIFGKWHLGYKQEYNPVHHGFDEFIGYLSGNVDYHSHFDNSGIFDWWHNLDPLHEEGYVTDLISEHAVDFIQRNKDKPFFLYVPHESPHVPFQGRQDSAYRFDHNEFTYYGPIEDRDRAYVDMVEAMDDGVGQIMKTLEELHLEENTLVFFISDNGAESFGHNGNLNGDKGSLLEGGHRVPAIAYWKGHIKPGLSNETIMTFDLMPTILSLTQTKTPERLALDGIDISHHLLDAEILPKRNLFWRYRKEKSVRSDQYKLLISDIDTMLFDLENDLTESENIMTSQAQRVLEMSNDLKLWELEIDKVIQKTK